MRSRGVSVSIILQNLAQLKALFEKQWESVVGNCDEFLYLGGNEQSTHKYVSELLGKETIDTNSYGKSSGRNGNYSTNYQLSGRELLTPDEVRMLDNRYALLFIRGERRTSRSPRTEGNRRIFTVNRPRRWVRLSFRAVFLTTRWNWNRSAQVTNCCRRKKRKSFTATTPSKTRRNFL